ncbi:MAG: VacB/RNase II family 3'-5' exoribonuclease [bacterium]|nr:VacB/RNase II family 3'-5' exoribonuclease [bacterium]
MAKGRGRNGGRPRGRSGRAPRPGRRERSAPKAGNGAGPRSPRGRSSRPARDEEGLVLTAEDPTSAGQWLEVETRDGGRVRVECLGEPVAVGARIGFVPTGEGHTRQGVLTRLISGERTTWVARVFRTGRGGTLLLAPFAGLEAPRFELHERDAKGARPGDRVLVAPLPNERAGKRGGRRVSRSRRHRGQSESGLRVRVLEVLGPAGAPDADHRALVWKHRLPTQFSRRARLEAEELDEAPRSDEAKHRIDLRHLPFVTIDPARARDHDDAVFAEAAPPAPVQPVDGPAKRPAFATRLWVAIADVAHFVEAGGFLDADARRRGNSFYFPDRALPMLPERLSSDLCSLRPDVDRRAMVVELRIDRAGQVVDALFHEAWIRSRARLAYEDAAAWLDRGTADGKDAPDWGPSLRLLDEIARDFSAARRREGGLELLLPEVELVVDDEGRPVDARLRARNRAHVLIEEAMLAANRAVARALVRADRPAPHRVHPPPSARKLDELARLLERYGIEAPVDLDEPGALARVLEEAEGAPFEERLHTAVLRSMSQARYEAESRGHYALRFEHYLHFTSPIRRYADLEVHRALRRLMRGLEPPLERAGEGGAVVALSAWLSGRERVAQEAERDADALASCALMAGRVGDTFGAEITGASEFGVFVRLDRPSVSGLVPMRLLAGDWRFDPAEDAILQGGGRARLAAGETIQVRLADVDRDRGRLSFSIVGRLAAEDGRRGRTRRR